MAHWKYRMQKLRKKWPSAHHCTTLSDYIFTIKASIDNQKKNLLNSNISSTCRHNMVNFFPLTAEICCWVWGTPPSFSGFCILAGFVTAPTSLNSGHPNCARCLAVSCTGTLYILLGWLSEQNSATCKIHFASKFCILLYWQHYCTVLEQWVSAKLCGVVQGMEL